MQSNAGALDRVSDSLLLHVVSPHLAKGRSKKYAKSFI
jgi:hypothetical protein